MADYKKFMFDNFVVENAPQETEEKPDEIVEDELLASEDDVTDTPFDEVEEVKPIEPTYSQADLDSKTKAARDEGYEDGYKTSQGSVDAGRAQLLTNVDVNLWNIFDKVENRLVEMEKETADLLKAALRKIVPPLLEENAQEIAVKFVQDNFANIKNEAKLAFYVNPDAVSYMQEAISDLARANDFEGKISIHKDPALSLSDCRIEWDKGGLERNSEAILDKIDDVLN